MGRKPPVMKGSSRPKADGLTGTGLLSLRLESSYETRGDSLINKSSGYNFEKIGVA